MTMKTMTKMFFCLLSLGVGFTLASHPASCVARCGEVFKRGQQCTCDHNCLAHNECCHDFQSLCTTAHSCRGRCAEPFRRGRQCECDPECARYNTCCHDYQLQCDASDVSVSLPLRTTARELPINSDLCSDSPINGLTALSNGTVLIFKGELFWSVDPVSRSVGPPKNITDTLGVPSPIDTVFTRCNCQGHTYIIKGEQFWLLDSFLAVKPGYPKPLASEFSGLNGVISAVLPMPATRGRPETIYFIKKGDKVQAYAYPTGGAPSCTKKPKPATNSRRFTRQDEGHLSGGINLVVSLKGFPTPVSAALSLPNPPNSGSYNHYLFSGPLFFTVQLVGGGQLGLAHPSRSPAPTGTYSLTSAPARPRPQSPAAVVTGFSGSQDHRPRPDHPSNSIRAWLQCP